MSQSATHLGNVFCPEAFFLEVGPSLLNFVFSVTRPKILEVNGSVGLQQTKIFLRMASDLIDNQFFFFP